MRGPQPAVNTTLATRPVGKVIVLCAGSGLVTERHDRLRFDRHSARIRLTAVSEIGIRGRFARTNPTVSCTAVRCLAPAALARSYAYRTIVTRSNIQGGTCPFFFGLPRLFIDFPSRYLDSFTTLSGNVGGHWRHYARSICRPFSLAH
jgi:hypothetical protein